MASADNIIDPRAAASASTLWGGTRRIPVARKADDVVGRADDTAHPLSPIPVSEWGTLRPVEGGRTVENVCGLFPRRSHPKCFLSLHR